MTRESDPLDDFWDSEEEHGVLARLYVHVLGNGKFSVYADGSSTHLLEAATAAEMWLVSGTKGEVH